MHIDPIKTDVDREAALREIECLRGAAENTEAGDRLDVPATLADTYERHRWPIEPLDPVVAIERLYPGRTCPTDRSAAGQ